MITLIITIMAEKNVCHASGCIHYQKGEKGEILVPFYKYYDYYYFIRYTTLFVSMPPPPPP